MGVRDFLDDFVVATDPTGTIIGVAGAESYGESCLLRSVAVDKRFRGHGHGRILVETVLRNAKAKGVRAAYLLTDDASHYFKQLGFDVVDRHTVDESVKASREFTELCPESATAMLRVLV